MEESELEAAELAYVTARPGSGSITGADADDDERAVEAALRPRTLDEVVGQDRVCEQLSLLLRPHRPAGARPTTCCSAALPAWARRRWR